jgi:hypothetical protein
MDQSGSKDQSCATLAAALPNGTIIRFANVVGNNLQVRKEDNVELIYVQGTNFICSYQISYISLDMPLKNAKLSQPYDLKLESK